MLTKNALSLGVKAQPAVLINGQRKRFFNRVLVLLGRNHGRNSIQMRSATTGNHGRKLSPIVERLWCSVGHPFELTANNPHITKIDPEKRIEHVPNERDRSNRRVDCQIS